MASAVKHLRRYLNHAVRASPYQQKRICRFHSTASESNIVKHQNLKSNKAASSTTMTDPRTSAFTKSAPDPLPGLYSQAIIANGIVYCSGNVAMDPRTNKIIDGDIGAHTHQCIKNLSGILNAAGSSINHVVKVNIFLADMADFAKMNEVYMTYWGDVKPCRTCVAVKSLPLGTDVEIECTAVVIDSAN